VSAARSLPAGARGGGRTVKRRRVRGELERGVREQLLQDLATPVFLPEAFEKTIGGPVGEV